MRCQTKLQKKNETVHQETFFQLKIMALRHVILLFLLGLLLSARGQLTPLQDTIEEKLNDGQSAFSFSFTLRNTGTYDVKIVEVKTSCGCTAAKPEKTVLSSGEIGEIKGSFSLQDRKGTQEQKITVVTDDNARPQIVLTVRAYVPSLYTLRPGLLFWKRGDAPSEKSIKIELDHETNYRVESATADSEHYLIKLERNSENERICTLKIKPLHTEQPIRGRITISLQADNLPDKTAFVYALIK